MSKLSYIVVCLLFVSPLRALAARPIQIETANFHVICCKPMAFEAVREIADDCERLRNQLQSKWLVGSGQPSTWNLRCKVVIHANRNGYRRAVGSGSRGTTGSSLLEFSRGKVVERRIDLVSDGSGRLSALSHELTHIVLADIAGKAQLPLWADEGIAMLADASDKRDSHRDNYYRALREGYTIPVAELLTKQQITQHQVRLFYGQSLMLVEFLEKKGGPSELISFLTLVDQSGYKHALQSCYQISDVEELQTLFRQYTRKGMKLPSPKFVPRMDLAVAKSM